MIIDNIKNTGLYAGLEKKNRLVKNKRIFFLISGFVLLTAGARFSYKECLNFQEERRRDILLEKRRAAWGVLTQDLEKGAVKFKGEAGIVIKDLRSNLEVSLNKERLFPSASLVKIPIMASCFYAVREGKIRLDDTFRLKSSDKVSGSGILKNLPEGSALSVQHLIELMIEESDNTAANMLIKQLGFDYLNDSFKALGLKNTNLSRKMMDFKYRKKGVENYTTAEDIAYILEKIYQKKFLNSNVSEQCLELLKQQGINDRIPAKLPAHTVVAHKTGLERRVCHDAGIVFTPKGDFLICVLTKGADTSKPAKKFIAQTALTTYTYYQQF